MSRRPWREKRAKQTEPIAAEGLAVPPHNVELEQAVLGAMLLDATALAVAIERGEAQDFYRLAHQRIFEAMIHLADCHEAVDTLTVTEELRRRGQLDSVGGVAALAELVAAVPSAANIRSHLSELRQFRQRRDAIRLGTTLVLRAREGEPIGGAIEEAEQDLFRLGHAGGVQRFEPVGHLLKDGLELIERLWKGGAGLTGLPSGFADLDRLTAGWQPGDLILIGARPSMGKTSFALACAATAAQQGWPVGIVSLEMSKAQLVLRLLSAEAGIDSHALRTGRLQKDEWWLLAEAAGRMEQWPLWIDDDGSLTLPQLRSKARRLKTEKGLALLIVDYLQLMRGPDGLESRQQEIAEISRGLKLLAKDLGIPVLALSQLSRAVELRTDKRPVLADLRESGSLEQDADVVLFLYRDEVYDPESEHKGKAELLLRKQRNGAIGEVWLAFLARLATFKSLAVPAAGQEAEG